MHLNEQENSVLDYLNRVNFLGAPDLMARVDLVQSGVQSRLHSCQLIDIWGLALMQASHAHNDAVVECLLREMLLLSPYDANASTWYDTIMRPRAPLPDPEEPVFMITSCMKYLDKAQALQLALRARGARACIITGDASLHLPQWHDGNCTLPVADTYEALPMKVVSAVAALVQRHGPCAIVKMDDDCSLTSTFDVRHFRHLASQHDYVGLPIANPTHDRLWHYGKTSVPLGVYGKRFNGPWANGSCYLLGSKACALLAREALLFPAEFADDYYEDKAIGDFLRRQGLVLQALQSHDVWGINVDTQERPFQ